MTSLSQTVEEHDKKRIIKNAEFLIYIYIYLNGLDWIGLDWTATRAHPSRKCTGEGRFNQCHSHLLDINRQGAGTRSTPRGLGGSQGSFQTWGGVSHLLDINRQGEGTRSTPQGARRLPGQLPDLRESSSTKKSGHRKWRKAELQQVCGEERREGKPGV